MIIVINTDNIAVIVNMFIIIVVIIVIRMIYNVDKLHARYFLKCDIYISWWGYFKL